MGYWLVAYKKYDLSAYTLIFLKFLLIPKIVGTLLA